MQIMRRTHRPAPEPPPLSVLRKKRPHGNLKRAWDLPDNALSHALREFLEWSAAHGYSATTLHQRQRAMRRFILWCHERGLNQLPDITLPILERYQGHLYHYRRDNGNPLTLGFQKQELLPIRAYFKWAVRARLTLNNPAAELIMPRVPQHLPRYILSHAQVERVINQADPSTLDGLRDRAMMEVLYSCAVRRTELARLKLHDVDTQRGSLLVREGKGKKDRWVPLGARACAWVAHYLSQRPGLLAQDDEGTLFLSDWGMPFHPDTLGDVIKRYLTRAGITAPGACHLFRHACATHMLEGGADIRFIQALLGHADLTSTQIYTHVSIEKLKAIHEATHPARLRKADTEEDVDAVEDV